MIKVQIVMPVINLWDYTNKAKDSILKAMVTLESGSRQMAKCRLLVIDNASTDLTEEEMRKIESPVIAYQRNNERWSFSKSVNFGVNNAFEDNYDYCVVVNNDILMHPGCLVNMLKGFEMGTYEQKPLALVSALNVRGETTPENLEKIESVSKKDVSVAPHPDFSAFMVSAETWATVGEFDELYAPAYFEDNDYHYRIKLAGMEGIVYPPAMFYHYGSVTQNRANEIGIPMVPPAKFEEMRDNYRKKWGGVPGEEQFTNPYNDLDKPLTTTQQDG